jgi:hypothetical protein
MNVQLAVGASLEALNTAMKSLTKINDPQLALQKADTFEQSGSAITGLTFYDLQPGALLLYPVLTPLRNMIPRVSGAGGIQANWRAITDINSGNISAGVSQGNRNAVMSVTTANYTAAYKGIGMESNVTFEAQYAGQKFDDIRALAGLTGLQALMLQEEAIILGGNGGGQPLGTTPTPTTADVVSGGSLSDGTYQVACVALTLEGYNNATVAGGIPTSVVRNNADGSQDTYGGGSAQKSAAAATVVNGGGAAQSITATVTAVRGAVAYAWYLSAAGGAASTAALAAITTVPAYTFTAAATGTQTYNDLPSADNSANDLVFDGLITQAFKSGSNAYWVDLAGGTLTADGDAGITQIDTALKAFWDDYRLSPDTMWVNSQQALDISKKILSGNVNGAFRINVSQAQGMMAGGVMATSYLNRFSMGSANVVDIKIHPNMPPGLILFTSSSIPYPLSGVGNVMQIKTRQDYYQIEWPLVTRKYEYGVYADEVLQHYFPPSMGLISGIGAG